MHHLTQFFAMQQMADQHDHWPRLRAVLQVTEGVPYVYDHTSYLLIVYTNGIPTWQKATERDGRPNPRQVADELLGEVLREAALTGFCQAARTRRELSRCHPNEAPACLSDEVVEGEILPV